MSADPKARLADVDPPADPLANRRVYESPLVRGRAIYWDEADTAEAEADARVQLRIDLLGQVTNRGRRLVKVPGTPGRKLRYREVQVRYPAMSDRYREVAELERFWTLQGRLTCAQALRLREATRAAFMLEPGIPELEDLARWLGLLPPREEAA